VHTYHYTHIHHMKRHPASESLTRPVGHLAAMISPPPTGSFISTPPHIMSPTTSTTQTLTSAHHGTKLPSLAIGSFKALAAPYIRTLSTPSLSIPHLFLTTTTPPAATAASSPPHPPWPPLPPFTANPSDSFSSLKE